MAVDIDFMKSSVAELRESFNKDWIPTARKIQSMIHPEPGTVMTSADLAGRIGSRPEQAMSHMSDYVSARMTLIKNNFVSRSVTFPPKIEPALIENDPEQQQRHSRLFQFFHGVHNVLNERTQETFLGTSWDRQVMENIAIFGKVLSIPHARNGSNGVEFSADILDNLSCYHDFDSWPRRFVSEKDRGVSDVRELLNGFMADGRIDSLPSELLKKLNEKDGSKDRNKTGESVTVSDFWVEEHVDGDKLKVWHGILVDDEPAGLWVTPFERLPVVGSMAHAGTGSFRGLSQNNRGSNDDRGVTFDRITHHASSVLAPLYYINEQFKQYMSLLMEHLARTMNPGTETIIGEDSREMPPTPDQIGPGSNWVHGPTIQMRSQEGFSGDVAQAADIFMRIIDGEFDRLANPVLFGMSNPGDAGYLFVNKISHANAVFLESTKAGSVFIKRVFDELTHQFKEANLEFHVDGWKYKGRGAPQFFPGGDFTKADLPDQYILNVEVLTDLPKNDAAKMDLFLQGAGKAFSIRQGRAHILDDEDPDLTQELIEQEQFEATPVIMSIRTLTALRREIKAVKDAAEDAADPLEAFELTKQAMFLDRAYQSAETQMLGQVENRFGQPEAQGRFSPETLPPEMGVGTNPDENAEARGTISSSLQGRPRTEGVV